MEKVTKQEILQSKCLLLNQKIANGIKLVYFELDDFDDCVDFNLNYNTQYTTGDSLHGNGFVDLEETLDAFGFNSYNELKNYLMEKFTNHTNCWNELIEEFESKGLDLNIDESEGFSDGAGGFCMSNI